MNIDSLIKIFHRAESLDFIFLFKVESFKHSYSIEKLTFFHFEQPHLILKIFYL